MPTFYDGLPLHVLLVHATTVLVPLAALVVLALLVRSRWRTRYGIAGGLVVLAALGTVPLATSTGEGLQNALPRDPLIEKHVQLADSLLPLMIVLAVGFVGWVLLDQYRRRLVGSDGPGTPGRAAPAWMGPVAALLLVVAGVGAVGSVVQVVRIGHAGSTASWIDKQYLPGQGPGGS